MHLPEARHTMSMKSMNADTTVKGTQKTNALAVYVAVYVAVRSANVRPHAVGRNGAQKRSFAERTTT